MLDTLLTFAAVCRQGEMRVSTAEAIDCAGHLELVDQLDEKQFHAVLRANFAKSRREQKAFDRLYRLFFHELRSDPEIGTPETEGETFGNAEQQLLDRLAGRDGNSKLESAIRDFLAGRPQAYLQVLQEVENREEGPGQGMKSNLGQLAGRLEIMLALNRIGGRIRALARQQGAEGRHNNPGNAAARLARRLATARSMLSEDTRPYNEALRAVKTHERHYEDLGEKPFSSLSDREIETMRASIDQLVRKLKDAATRRYASQKSGMLDVKQTLRRAGRFQGVPLELKFKDRPLRKAKIVTLCDVSGSVWSAARFMLHLLYALQDCFSDVSSFAFVCAPTDLSATFAEHDVHQAIEKVLNRTDIGFDAVTDYGEVFYQFHRDCLHLLTRRTTLIILGDGRSNYHHPREKLLESMRARCRRIVWLNPEPEEFWGTGDSEMPTYMAYCHELRPCRNFNQLIDFIRDLVL